MNEIILRRGGVSIRPVYFAGAALLALAACSDRQMQIYNASETGGDYAVLSCEELNVALLTIGQRLSGSASYASLGEPSGLRGSQGRQISDVRSARNCPGGETLVARKPVEVIEAAQPEKLLEEAAYIQIATFLVEPNRDATVEKLRAMGLPVIVRPILLAGSTFHRVIVGPLKTVEEVALVDRTAIQMGFDDAFFVKG